MKAKEGNEGIQWNGRTKEEGRQNKTHQQDRQEEEPPEKDNHRHVTSEHELEVLADGRGAVEVDEPRHLQQAEEQTASPGGVGIDSSHQKHALLHQTHIATLRTHIRKER